MNHTREMSVPSRFAPTPFRPLESESAESEARPRSLLVGDGGFRSLSEAVAEAAPHDEIRVQAALFEYDSCIITIPLRIVGV
ncbi:MAG TPA: hypothetical protein VGC80_07875, partial [Acetobacteraceae bacterium]